MSSRLPPRFLTPCLYQKTALPQAPPLPLSSPSISSNSQRFHTRSQPQCSYTTPQSRPRPRLHTSPCPNPSSPFPPSAQNRPFHSSPHHQQPQQPPIQDHYATLSLPPSAAPLQIKKSFYALSKTHHPDRTRALPKAEAEQHTRTYVAISEAYAVLGDKAKRENYDREWARHFGPQHPSPASGGAGGYAGGGGQGEAETAQAMRGGRPASGLSRRRTAFRGPPPSFYRSGGWGASGAKRKENAYTAGSGAGPNSDAGAGAGGSGYAAGSEAGEGGAGAGAQQEQGQGQKYNNAEDDPNWPFTTDPNDVPHFNRRIHYHTQTTIEAQLRQGRQKRRHEIYDAKKKAMEGVGYGYGYADGMGVDPEEVGAASVARNFAVVSGIMAIGLGGGWLLFGMGGAKGGRGREMREKRRAS